METNNNLHRPTLDVDTLRWECADCGAFIDALDFEQWNGIRFHEPEQQVCPAR